jgi:hypothetical protein
MQFLLLCSRKEAPGDRAAHILSLAQEPLDWQFIVTSAADHHISQLLSWHVKHICPQAPPPIWNQYLASSFQRILRRNLMLSAELLRLLDAFQSVGVLAIPYKGPALAALAYGNLALREFGDLDLLIAHADIQRAIQVVLDLDYQTHARVTGHQRSGEPVPGQYLFWRDHDRYLVELHTERTLRYFPRSLPIEKLRQRLQRVHLGGRDVFTLGMDDLLNFLCVHGSKHFWNRLQWIADIAELVDGGLIPDLAPALARGGELGSRRMLLLGLRLAGEILGANVPEEIRRQYRDDPAVDSMAAQVREIIFAQRQMLPGILQRMKFRMKMSGSVAEGLRYGLRLATVPTEEDWLGTRLPRPLTPLYALLRPLRLLGKYGAGLKQRVAPDLAPFVPTPPDIVRKMLDLAELTKDDVLYDIGCGNGQIVIAAATQFGARCVGMDVDPQRIAEARAFVRSAAVGHLVTLIHDDARHVDLSRATVVTMYLTIPGNAKLWHQLNRQLRPGVRVVSRDFDMPGWRAEKLVELDAAGGIHTTLYLWRIGASRP